MPKIYFIFAPKALTILKTHIAITSFASVSPLGTTPEAVWQAYLDPTTAISLQDFEGTSLWAASLTEETQNLLENLRQEDARYKALDTTVLMAILASRKAVAQAGWEKGSSFGVNLGSSRGATQLFEKYHQEFLTTGRTATLASPTTTLGNIASWVAHDLHSQGPEISHSITCSTALHAILNAAAWLQAGMSTQFLVGGSEAPLTPFTLAQMQAMKIYAPTSLVDTTYPNRAMDLQKTYNSLVLGEGAAVACLEKGTHPNALAYIQGIGYATEELEHNVSISEEALCFQKSMQMALHDVPLSEVDAIVMHAPGTVKGDQSEYKAIQKIFGATLPLLTTNKWKLGHTFGASGMLSVELALLMLQHQTFIGVPFTSSQTHETPLRKILINAVGFGGNAVSVLIGL